MEFEENNLPEEQEEDSVEIYSKRAIFWFSVLSPLFGGALLLLNLKAAGYKKALYTVAIFTLLYYFLSNILLAAYVGYYKIDLQAYQAKILAYKGNDLSIIDGRVVLLMVGAIGANVLGGLILSRYFFRRYFPENDYYPKSILSPLFVTIVIMFILRMTGLGGF
jgi:hypothetical protein